MAILGIDEVGRGPWAGPLVIGAVILPSPLPTWANDLTDSKKLSVKKREHLNEIILKEAPATGLGWVSSQELDQVGLAKALRIATQRAVHQICDTGVPFDEIIIDGTINFLEHTTFSPKVTILKKADFLIKEVSAASIIAKVARDHYMYDLAHKYPEYGFEKHVGYGTAAHKKALETYGPCPEHRQSFKPVTKHQISTTDKGQHAEGIVASYLASHGHRILARNYKTKLYEIDIISTQADKIYFTEVKYRKDQSRGTSLEQITTAKQHQMRFAATAFLKTHPEFKHYNPILAAASVFGEDYQLETWLPITA